MSLISRTEAEFFIAAYVISHIISWHLSIFRTHLFFGGRRVACRFRGLMSIAATMTPWKLPFGNFSESYAGNMRTAFYSISIVNLIVECTRELRFTTIFQEVMLSGLSKPTLSASGYFKDAGISPPSMFAWDQINRVLRSTSSNRKIRYFARADVTR